MKKKRIIIITSIILITLAITSVGGFIVWKNIIQVKLNKGIKEDVISSSKSVPIAIPSTSTCAITFPPSNMDGVNNHMEMYGNTGADPNIVTLGPTIGPNPKDPKGTTYPGKRGMEFELNSKAPLLAPIDMTLIGFQNNSAKEGTGADGKTYSPFNDIVLYFESASPDWPGMVIVAYHLYTSPLLPGHYQNSNCGDVDTNSKNTPAEGHLFFPFDDYIVSSKDNTKAFRALIGRTVKRGELIGYAGNVGEHSFASFCFKVSHTIENPTVKKGNKYLHWVQPGAFFYWKSYSPDASFPSGVLAYPFEIDGYQLSAEQRDVNFKYTSTK